MLIRSFRPARILDILPGACPSSERRTRMPKTMARSKAPAKKSAPAGARKAPEPIPEAGGISDQAVTKATGRGWAHWFALLDKAGAASKDHQGIVACLYPKHLKDGWWCQMITVAYEQARGLRQKHQKPGGFEISGSKTIEAPLTHLFAAWADDAVRRVWLGPYAAITIRKSTPGKSMRITWIDGASHVDANFYAKGPAKSMVQVNHGKLRSAAEARKWKQYWGRTLDKLKLTLEP
jgi:hypothetical protein